MSKTNLFENVEDVGELDWVVALDLYDPQNAGYLALLNSELASDEDEIKAEWREEDHPRAKDGEFGAGGAKKNSPTKS